MIEYVVQQRARRSKKWSELFMTKHHILKWKDYYVVHGLDPSDLRTDIRFKCISEGVWLSMPHNKKQEETRSEVSYLSCASHKTMKWLVCST